MEVLSSRQSKGERLNVGEMLFENNLKQKILNNTTMYLYKTSTPSICNGALDTNFTNKPIYVNTDLVRFMVMLLNQQHN